MFADEARLVSWREAAERQRANQNEPRRPVSTVYIAAGDAFFDQIKIVRGELSPTDVIEWHRLEQNGLTTPFQRHDWLDQWQLLCAPAIHEQAVTALGYCGGQLMLILPLSLWRRWGVGCLSWRAHEANDYCGPVMHRSVSGQLNESQVVRLFKQVAERAGGVDIIYLPKQLLRLGGQANPFILTGSEAYHAGVHAIALGHDWESYYKSRRSAKSRKRLKEKFAALDRLGQIEFRMAQTGAEKSKIVSACLDLKSRQLAKLGHWDPFSDANLCNLLKCYAESERDGRFWAASLDVDAEPAAVAFGFSDKDEWLLYQMAMAAGPAARYSPGTLLLHKLMQHCIAHEAIRLDLSLGDEPYKLEWCTEHEKLATSFLAITPIGGLCAAVLKARATAHRLAASHPVTYAFARRLKAVFANWR
jgi:CelD/BcsL family acetyltransferase involved in cellulose biosynthesis